MFLFLSSLSNRWKNAGKQLSFLFFFHWASAEEENKWKTRRKLDAREGEKSEPHAGSNFITRGCWQKNMKRSAWLAPPGTDYETHAYRLTLITDSKSMYMELRGMGRSFFSKGGVFELVSFFSDHQMTHTTFDELRVLICVRFSPSFSHFCQDKSNFGWIVIWVYIDVVRWPQFYF